MTDRIHTVVVGAGVVGLAIARAEAMAGRDVVILEAADRIGTGTSSRNSEVLHAGIFHPPGTMKTRFCVAGRRALYDYCAARGIPHRRTGKLLVATDETERPILETYLARAEANGLVGDDALVALTAAEARALEPALRCIFAVSSPGTGLVDSHRLMRALLADAESSGAVLACRTPVEAVALAGDGGFSVTTRGATPTTIACHRLINATGLGAPDVARRMEGYDQARIPRQYLVKGSYFAFRGRSPFTRPIYPPQRGGFSVHATIDLGGRLKFGPDAEPVERLDFDVDPRRAASFYAAIRTYWPELPDDGLEPAYAGIRPRLQAPGQAFHDFVIDGPDEHGIAGLVQLFGIESPGLTSCLAIADHVRRL